jgi:hypothetical protein
MFLGRSGSIAPVRVADPVTGNGAFTSGGEFHEHFTAAVPIL